MLDLPEQHTAIQPSFPAAEVIKEAQRCHLTAAVVEVKDDQDIMDSADALEGSSNE
jgi:hypothetical protein